MVRLSTAGATGVVDAGLVERRVSGTDRGVTRVGLTSLGWKIAACAVMALAGAVHWGVVEPLGCGGFSVFGAVVGLFAVIGGLAVEGQRPAVHWSGVPRVWCLAGQDALSLL